MAVVVAEGLVQHRQVPSYELVTRAMREFDDLPTLRITLEQAMRLFDVDREACVGLLRHLVEAGMIRTDECGRYCNVAVVDWPVTSGR